jgi:tetratricopeptide (TPR) repeat protein
MIRSLALCLIALSALASSTVAATPAAADQTDKRLPELFSQLKQASSPEAASAVEAKIWDIWIEAGDPVIDKMMAEGSMAMTAADFQTALDLFSAIIEKKPKFAEGWNKRATLYYVVGEYEKSLADINHVLELEPRHIGALSGLGLVNIQLGHDEAAADAFQRVLDIDPQNVGAKANLAVVNDRLKRQAI